MTDGENKASGSTAGTTPLPMENLAPRTPPVAIPWYRRPWFWGLLLFLCLLLLAAWLLRKDGRARKPGVRPWKNKQRKPGTTTRHARLFLRQLRLLLEKTPAISSAS